MKAQQAWIVFAPNTKTNLLAVFDSTWSKEQVNKGIKAKFTTLREFSMRRLLEGSCIVQALDGEFDNTI